jgi:hypothetical protein
VSRGRMAPAPDSVPDPRGAPASVPEPVQPGLARLTTVAAQCSVAGHSGQFGPATSGFTPGRVAWNKSHSVPVSLIKTAI